MPEGTKVAEAEKALKSQARKKGFTGKRAARYVYGALNSQGLKRGSRTTAKGRRKASRPSPNMTRTARPRSTAMNPHGRY